MTYRFNYASGSSYQVLNHEVAITLDELKGYIDQLLDNFDIDKVSDEHLYIIADLIGFPIDKETDPDFKRRSLRSAIDLYKAKGTVESVVILFYTLGLNVEVLPLWTPDYTDMVEIFPPYIVAETAELTGNNKYEPGLYDVTVINPDLQYHTVQNMFEYI